MQVRFLSLVPMEVVSVGKQGQSRKKATNKEYGRRGKYSKGKRKKKK